MSKLFQANDLDASAAIDKERADALRAEAAALEQRATEKREKAADLRKRSDAPPKPSGPLCSQ